MQLNWNSRVSIFKISSSKFQISSSKSQIQIPKIKSFSKELHKSIKVFSPKMKKINQIRRKSHISKIVGPQSPHHLKSNPKFWLFAGNNQIKVEKLFDWHFSSSDQSRKALWSTFHPSSSEVEKASGYLSSRSR